MFIDEVEIYVKAGKGGNGVVSFRREKFIPEGGPDGGDGGRGGDILIEVDSGIHGLSEYNRQKKFLAPDGEKGMGKNKHGKNAVDLILKVPAGTQIFEKDELIADMIGDDQKITIVSGGNGGWGNQHFATSIKQAPAWAKDGMRGEGKKLKLIWKTIADIGVIGLPNAGKSTLLSVLTSAHPKIADYPFTTLEPNLGTFIDRETRIIIADIPGLIEGASLGRGLGDRFLRHVERTKILIHILDAASLDLTADYKTIRNELKAFSKEMLNKKEIVVLNKIDTVSPDKVKEDVRELKKKKISPIVISAATHEGLEALTQRIKLEVSEFNRA
ncbi:MAG: GTPase ObgE [Patescibacteria group bacterium]